MNGRFHQRGVAALAVSVLLLFGMTLIGFFANRALLFEQKTSANHYRSTRAFEVAEAGLEWAISMLNDTRPMDTACEPLVTATTFRKNFVPRNAFNAFSPVANSTAACRITGSSATAPGSLVCSCPTAGTAATLTASNEPRFTVEFAVVPGDPNSFAITSYGCVGQGSVCETGTGASAFDSRAMVAVTVKQRTSMPFVPTAALTVGRNADIGSAANAENVDPAANGVLIDAGQSIGIRLSRATTIPGTPDQNALIANDAPLYALSTADTTGDTMFRKFFGMSIADYADQGRTETITGGSAELAARYAAGATSFYVPGDISVGDIGTPTRPVIIVGEGNIKIKGTAYGLIYSNNLDWNAKGMGNADIVGAVIARGNIEVNSNPTFTYNAAVLKEVREVTSDLVRVPGSWRDFPIVP